MSTPTPGESPYGQDQYQQPQYGQQAPQYGQAPYGQQPGYGYPPPPQQQQGTSGIAIAALCTFWLPVVGLVLSIIGMVKTGNGKARGRGLAIAALVLSILNTVGTGVGIAMVASKSSVLDPGCTKGKAAILDGSAKLKKDGSDPAALKPDLQQIVASLDQAIADSHRDDVKAAMQAIRGDYADLLSGLDTGNLSPDFLTKLETDAQQVDHLCTIGSK